MGRAGCLWWVVKLRKQDSLLQLFVSPPSSSSGSCLERRKKKTQEAGQIKYSNFAKRMARAKQQRIIIWRKCAKEAARRERQVGRPWDVLEQTHIFLGFFCLLHIFLFFILLYCVLGFFFLCVKSQQTCPKLLLQFLVSSRKKRRPKIFAHKAKAVNYEAGVHGKNNQNTGELLGLL